MVQKDYSTLTLHVQNNNHHQTAATPLDGIAQKQAKESYASDWFLTVVRDLKPNLACFLALICEVHNDD